MMKTNNFTAIGSAALVTATLTVALFLPGFVNAGNGSDIANARIAQPRLVSHGAQLTLAAAESGVFKAGDAPVFELTATNTTSQAEELSVRVYMTASAPQNRMSRMVTLPANLWEKTCALSLNPHETKIITLKTDAKLPANNTIDVLLAPVAGNSSAESSVQSRATYSLPIVALTYSTLVSTPEPSEATPASSRGE
jgi:hypothetical protein